MNLLLFDILTILLIVIDMYNYKKQITPLTIFGGIYVFLINLNNLVISNVYGFISVDSYALFIIFLVLFMIFLVDFLWGIFYRKSKHFNYSFSTRFRSYQTVMILFFTGVLAYSIQFFLLYRSYGLSIKGLNGGILGHLSSFAFILGPVVIDLAMKSKKKNRIFISLLLNLLVLVISIAFGGKYVIFINLTYFLLYFILKRDQKTNVFKLAKVILPLICIAVMVFIIIYYFIPILTGQYQSTMSFAMQHMFYYLLGSISANNFSIAHAGGGDALIPFTVVINIWRALIGNNHYINSVLQFIFPVYESTYTNVSGIIGESIFQLGIIEAMFYIFVIFNVINYFYYQYRCKNRFYLTFLYSNAIIVFLYFGNYYTVSGVVLVLLLAILLDIFSLCKIGKYHI